MSRPDDRLADRWHQLAQSLSIDLSRVGAGFAELVAAYQAPDRHYHTLEHIGEMLELFATAPQRAADPLAVQLAVWYHDAVYDARRHNNEARSADLATKRLREWGLSNAMIEHVGTLIQATCHDGTLPAQNDTAFLLDLDLAILGTSPERYDRYAADIRREYAWVADANYRHGRSVILARFLERPCIYSAELWAGQEAQARANLERELADLQKKENRR